MFELNLKIKHKSNKKNSANESFWRRDYKIETHVKNETKNRISEKSFNLKNNVLKIRNWTLIFANDVLKNNSKFISNRLKKNFQKSENNNNFTNIEKKMIDDKSKCSHFSDENTSKNIVFIAQCNSIQKILQSALSTNVTKKILLWRLNKFFEKKINLRKKKRRTNDQNVESKLHRFVNVEKYEDFVFTNLIKKMSNKNSTLIVLSLKLRSVRFIF